MNRLPIESITIEVDGRKITMPRAEVVSDERIEQVIENFERLRYDSREADYERQKLAHAQLSMQAQMNRLCQEYADNKYGIKANEEPADDKDRIMEHDDNA